MNYQEAVDYLDSLNKLGSVPGLDSIRELLHRLGNPQNQTRYVHVAGTNGKGSTCAFIRQILIEAGYKVGGFNSPAVFELLEIITLNNKNIMSTDYAKYVERIKIVCDEMVRDGLNHPTRFEIETAIAFCFFADSGCDIAVVECGMGGLLDSTNIITTVDCAVITSLALDHTGFLGNTIEEIALNKAGIIKSYMPVVIASDNEQIKTVAKNNKAEYIVADKPYNIEYSPDGLTFDYKEYKGLKSNLLGCYQPSNAALAIECVRVLMEKGYRFTEEQIYSGIKNALWKGRFTRISSAPDFFIDGAHNPHGAEALADCIRSVLPGKKITFIIGVFADKEYDKIIDSIIEFADKIFTVETPNNPRALSSKALAEFIKNNYDVFVRSCDNISDAVHSAYENTDKNGVIIACGSLSHLAIIEKEVKRYNNG